MRGSQLVAAYADGLIQCEHCRIWFAPDPKRKGGHPQRFCSDSCRITHWQQQSAAS